MPNKIDKDFLKEDKGRQITERPIDEPLIKSDIPDFLYTPTPPEPDTNSDTEED